MESSYTSDMRATAGLLDKDSIVGTYCNKVTIGNAAQNIMIIKGFRCVNHLSGGMKQYSAARKKRKRSLAQTKSHEKQSHAGNPCVAFLRV
jgi:hypothetical protein